MTKLTLTLTLAMTMMACATTTPQTGARSCAVTETVSTDRESALRMMASLSYDCLDRGITEACHAAAQRLPPSARIEKARLYERAFGLGDESARGPWLASLRAR